MASEDPEKVQEVRKYLKQSHDRIFDNNKKWAAKMREDNPEFFTDLTRGQNPEYLWIGKFILLTTIISSPPLPTSPPLRVIANHHHTTPTDNVTDAQYPGCSDSRIPAEAITGLKAGEMFIHRNIANLVNNIDLNVMSVVNYAVRHLKVKHIVVCGHYGCGGVKAAMTPKDMGLLNPWLRNIRDVYRLHQDELDKIPEEQAKYDRLVELNVHEQCRNIIKTAAVQQCWAENEFPVVHGWVFGFGDGLLKDLKFDHEGQLHEIQKIYDLTKDV
jgi:carbonic anhydrase